MRTGVSKLVLALIALSLVAPVRAAGPSYVDMTWLSISNIYYELGALRILTDGYITRLPQSAFFGGGGGLATTRQAFKPDVNAVTRVLGALGGPASVNLLLTGHSHFDHSFDTATWARLTGARIVGSKTTCFQATAEGIPAGRCAAVYGGEKFALAEGVTLRVVRWNHSGSPTTNPEQHNPVELDAAPRPDPQSGGLRGGVAEDFPNGGGNRAFLFVVDGPEGRFSWFYQNSASAVDLHVPIVIDGTDFGAPIENLKAALKAEGLDSVDLWIGTGGLTIAQLVLPVIKAKAYLPVHWDGLWGAFQAGVPQPYSDPPLEDFLAKSGVNVIKPAQYLDKWRLDRKGVRPVPNDAVKQALGFTKSSAALNPGRASAAVPCDTLARLSLPDATVTSAQNVDAGAFVPPTTSGRGMSAAQRQTFAQLPAFCRVALTSKPSSDSDIRIEVWLPAGGWNGSLQAVGDGGLAGVIPYVLMAPALGQGFVASGTDTGHVGGNADFMPGHPEKLVDFAYRSTHQMAIAAKAIAAAFYGNPPKWSYYNACSGGGRHALTSAQRYPEDFQGIVAGAASWDQARLDAARIGINLTVNRTLESRIPANKYPMIHQAVLQACDAADGVKDGVLEDPRTCAFDYAALACKGADGPSCLTPAQVESAKVLTSPFKDPATGRTLLQSHLWPGAELQWANLGGPEPPANSLERVRNFHLKDPAWEFRRANIAADLERAVRMDDGLMGSVHFNLRPFFDRGGKLLMWHGWSDPQVPAEHSVVFFNNVTRIVGADAERSLALFMLPGVSHCGGGPGPDTFDKMTAIADWVERGVKPSRIVASKMADGRVDRTRPLCPFGQEARYSGRGSTDDAANFSCQMK